MLTAAAIALALSALSGLMRFIRGGPPVLSEEANRVVGLVDCVVGLILAVAVWERIP